MTEEKVSHVPKKYAADIKWLCQSYPDITAHSFDNVRQSKCKVTRKSELISEAPISRKLSPLPPIYNDIVKEEEERTL